MLSKLSSGSIVLLFAIHVHGHALVSPDLNGGTARADVTRPSTAAPCGAGVDVASLINTAQTVPVTNGNVDATITNFNDGTDGSRFVTALVDPTGTGNSFQAATVTTNGDKDPTDVGPQPLVVQLPAGIAATGGTAGNRMLIAFTTLGGFGNCIAATTGDATAASSNSTTTTATSTGTGKVAAGNSTTTDTTPAAAGAAGAGAGKAAKGTGKTAGAGAGAAAKGTKAAKGKGKKHQKAKGANAAAGAGAGTAAGAKKAQRHRQMQKLKLRNAVYALLDSESE